MPAPDFATGPAAGVFRDVRNALTLFKSRKLNCTTEEAGPEGYTLRVEIRKSGDTVGQRDYYLFTPARKRLRSLPDLARHLGDPQLVKLKVR